MDVEFNAIDMILRTEIRNSWEVSLRHRRRSYQLKFFEKKKTKQNYFKV